MGDENRIRQVVANLLGNARRFTADDIPRSTCASASTPRPGWAGSRSPITERASPSRSGRRIFQRFWRADTSPSRETGGTGLGLSIVASIVDALHGAVSVGDTPGGGATFRVAFPLVQERDAAEQLLTETQPLSRIEDDVD